MFIGKFLFNFYSIFIWPKMFLAQSAWNYPFKNKLYIFIFSNPQQKVSIPAHMQSNAHSNPPKTNNPFIHSFNKTESLTLAKRNSTICYRTWTYRNFHTWDFHMEMYHVIKTARLSEKIRVRWKISAWGFLVWETFFFCGKFGVDFWLIIVWLS